MTHPHEHLIYQEAGIQIRGEAHLWRWRSNGADSMSNTGFGWDYLNFNRPLFSTVLHYTLEPTTQHPHHALWHEWQKLLASGEVDRGEVWIDFDGGKTSVCEWHADKQYKIVRKAKKRLIDWAKMPRGVMTNIGKAQLGMPNIGEFQMVCNDTCSAVLIRDSPLRLINPFTKNLRLAPEDQQPWLLWMGGECPVPKVVKVRVLLRDGIESDYVWSLHRWFYNSRTKTIEIIAYKVTGLEEGWTDNPEEA